MPHLWFPLILASCASAPPGSGSSDSGLDPLGVLLASDADTGWQTEPGQAAIPDATPDATPDPETTVDTADAEDTGLSDGLPAESGLTDCSDGLDNDQDGLVDCEEADCFSEPACLETVCDDGIDNDGDGGADCWDEDCWQVGACTAVDLEVQVHGGRMIGRHLEPGGLARSAYTSSSSSSGWNPTWWSSSWWSSSWYSSSWYSSSWYSSSWSSAGGGVYGELPIDRVDAWDVAGVARVTVQPGSVVHSCAFTVDHMMHSVNGGWTDLRRTGLAAEPGCGLSDPGFLPAVQLGTRQVELLDGRPWYHGQVTGEGSHASGLSASSWWSVEVLELGETAP